MTTWKETCEMSSEANMNSEPKTITNGMLCKITHDAIIKACNGEPYNMSLVGREAEVVIKAVNMGIDSHLEAVFGEFNNGERSITATSDSNHWKEGDKLVLAHTLECEVEPESLPTLLRRLYEDMEYTGEDGDDADHGHSLAEGILMTLGFDDCGNFVGREALGLE